jgi:RecA/RadA recombinase
MALSKDKKKAMMKLRDEFIKQNKLPENTKIGFPDENEEIGKIERLPTGLIAFDVLTGGGWVKNKINQLVGGESAGKSTSLLMSTAHWQKDTDFLSAYIPAEKNFDREWAEANGVDLGALWVYEPRSAEENLDFVMKCTSDGSPVNCLIIDTLQALASVKEIYAGKKPDGSHSDKERSTEDDSMALIPRLYSQFLRMYTAKTADTLTLILTSQVRTDIASMARMKDKETGGNALKHYNVLNVKMNRVGDTKFPAKEGDKIPPNSFAVQLEITKSKVKNRYRGNKILMYFYKGKFEHKFNVLGLGKELGLHDGKTYKYVGPEGPVEIKAKGFNDMYNKITDEAIADMESKLMDAYTKQVMDYIPTNDEVGVVIAEEEEDGAL